MFFFFVKLYNKIFQQAGPVLRQAEHLNFALNQFDTTLVTAFNNRYPPLQDGMRCSFTSSSPAPGLWLSAIEVEENITRTWLSRDDFGYSRNL
jgi:hypothetical protein